MKIYTSCQPGGFKESFYEIIDTIKEVGFDGVFLSCEETDLTGNEIEYVKNKGLDIETLHLQYNKPRRFILDLQDNNNLKDDALNILKRNIDLAYKYDIKKVVMHSSSGKTPTRLNNTNINNYIEIVEYCKQKDITICFENIRVSEYQDDLLNYFKDYDNVKACFDIGHANAFTKDLNTKDYSNTFKRLGCVHIHDNDGTFDYHIIPGMGNIDFVKHFKNILKYTNNFNYTLELYLHDDNKMCYKSDMTVKEFYTKAFNAISKIKENIEK